jgi:hypothetical protein
VNPAIWTSPSLSVPAGRHVPITWTAFAARVERPRAAPSKESLARWAPVEFRASYRCRANVIRAHACVLDVDDGSTLESIVRALEGLFAIAHSTFNATAEAPRWRIVVPLDRCVDADCYDRVWRWLAGAVEAEDAGPDYAARDASRAWAVPAVPPSGYYVARIFDGAFACVADALIAIPREEAPVGTTSRDESYDSKVRRARQYLAKMPGAISGSGGHMATFKAALCLVRGFALESDDALALMIQDYNPRCAPEWTVSELRHKVRQAMQRARQPYAYLADRHAR